MKKFPAIIISYNLVFELGGDAMLWLEVQLKRAKFRPLQIVGEILFGTMGEYWEGKRINKEVGA